MKPRSRLKQILMERDGMTSEEADVDIAEGKEELNQLIEEGNMTEAMDFMERWGLEPDYLEDMGIGL